MDIELTHYSKEPVDLQSLICAEQSNKGYSLKPRGFWVGVGSAWAEWCIADNYQLNCLAVKQRVILSSDANILTISNVVEFDKFDSEFREQSVDSYFPNSPDWAKVAQHWNGIIISPYLWDRRMDSLWYYGWDVASGCIWNPKVIASIEVVKRQRRQQ